MTSMLDLGCEGCDCPRKNRCERYIRKEDRKIIFARPPYNRGLGDNSCNYYEPPKNKN